MRDRDNAAALGIDVEDGSDLTIDGACTHVDASVSDGSELAAAGLKCNTAHIDVSESSVASLHVDELLTGSISDGSVVTCHGSGHTDVEVSSGSDLDRR